MVLYGPGTYAIINKKSGTVLEPSGGDQGSITGEKRDEEKAQMWMLFSLGKDIWEIHRMGGGGHSMGVSGSPGPGARESVVPGPVPVQWVIFPIADDPDHVYSHITCPKTSLNMSLANDGSSTAGTPVELESRSSADNQLWRFQHA